ncbi:MAG: helix-turn-helix domain-containing protein [Bacteroidota bacterium]
MEHYTTLAEYCQAINITPPKWNDFDIRSFEDNMKTVKHQMPPFKHEFYAIALKLNGSGQATTGNYSTKDLKATVFFNSPYQIIHWDIAPDWEGYYIIFSEDFYRELSEKRLAEMFPFLLVDNTIPLELKDDQAGTFLSTFNEMMFEFDLNQSSSKAVIRHYTHVLLHRVSRLFENSIKDQKLTQQHRDNDLELVSRFKTLIEISFYPDQSFDAGEPHQVQFYADKLNVHPNHLNAIVKRITDTPASAHIHKHVLALAKSKLQNTTKSVKEIAFELYYGYPNHFANFFKKQTGNTPIDFRKSLY